MVANTFPDDREANEPKKLSMEESIALLQSWIDDLEEPTDEGERLWQEMIRDLDSFRPERPLFEKYYR